jgi:hypothetical protein
MPGTLPPWAWFFDKSASLSYWAIWCSECCAGGCMYVTGHESMSKYFLLTRTCGTLRSGQRHDSRTKQKWGPTRRHCRTVRLNWECRCTCSSCLTIMRHTCYQMISRSPSGSTLCLQNTHKIHYSEFSHWPGIRIPFLDSPDIQSHTSPTTSFGRDVMDSRRSPVSTALPTCLRTMLMVSINSKHLKTFICGE